MLYNGFRPKSFSLATQYFPWLHNFPLPNTIFFHSELVFPLATLDFSQARHIPWYKELFSFNNFPQHHNFFPSNTTSLKHPLSNKMYSLATSLFTQQHNFFHSNVTFYIGNKFFLSNTTQQHIFIPRNAMFHLATQIFP